MVLKVIVLRVDSPLNNNEMDDICNWVRQQVNAVHSGQLKGRISHHFKNKVQITVIADGVHKGRIGPTMAGFERGLSTARNRLSKKIRDHIKSNEKRPLVVVLGHSQDVDFRLTRKLGVRFGSQGECLNAKKGIDPSKGLIYIDNSHAKHLSGVFILSRTMSETGWVLGLEYTANECATVPFNVSNLYMGNNGGLVIAGTNLPHK